jgi:O-glycosyl hydrolase
MFTKKIVTAASILAILSLLALAACELSEAEAPRKSLMKPYISVQPQSASYYNGQYGNDPKLVYSAPPTLSVEVWDWESDDGKLTYQWYEFDKITDYGTDAVKAIPGAEGTGSKSEYTPTITDTASGKQYFYYVVVSNTNSDALDEVKTASLQSEVAVISFSAPSEPLMPVISRNPADARFRWGATLNSLQVKAAAPDRGQLTYQWYNNDTFSSDGGDIITGAIQSTFIPDPATLKLGDNFFYVVVSNTVTTGSAPAQMASVPVNVYIERGVRATAPRINVQPKDQFVFTGKAAAALTVEAESLDGGVLSYQWYSNSVASVKDSQTKQKIDGEVTESYTPSAGQPVLYYFVEVKNTNVNVEKDQEAVTTSKPAKVQVGSAGVPAGVTPNAFFTIPDPDGTHLEGGRTTKNRYQYIRGYGGMDVAWGNFPRTSQADTELMYDPERLGYNMLRIMIRADNVDPGKTIEELLVGDRPDYINNVKIVNRYGGYVEGSPWTPPKDWKSNNSINGGGNLIPAYYKLYANYLRNFSQYMYDHGAPIYAISISNEPNYVAGYDGCEWTQEEMRDFFLEVGHFTDGIRGFGGGKETPYVLTVNGESANSPNINVAALSNPKSKAAIDVVARHIYGSRKDSLWNNTNWKPLITKKDAEGNDVMMEVWMTEHNINSANATGYVNDSTWNYVWTFLNDVDLVIRINNENAFVWWASKRFYSMVGDGQSGTTDGAPLPRGWALSHYSRYTNDYTRIYLELTPGETSRMANGTVITLPGGGYNDVSSNVNNNKDDMDNVSPRITAFVSPDGNAISIVLWAPTLKAGRGTGYDMGWLKVDLPFEVEGVAAHRSTSATDIFREDNSIVLSDTRTSAFINLPEGVIVSVKFTKKAEN